MEQCEICDLLEIIRHLHECQGQRGWNQPALFGIIPDALWTLKLHYVSKEQRNIKMNGSGRNPFLFAWVRESSDPFCANRSSIGNHI